MRVVVSVQGYSISVSSCNCCMFVSCMQPVAMRSAVFCIVCSFCMLVGDAMGDHMVEAYSYSSMGLVMAVYMWRV